MKESALLEGISVESLLQKYTPYIKYTVSNYKLLFHLDESLFDDLFQEASLAFVRTLEKQGLPDTPVLTPYMLYRCKMAMKYAMRTFIWQYFGEKNIHRRFNRDNVILFSDIESTNEEGDTVNPVDLVGVYDDMSRLNIDMAEQNLTKVERSVLDMWAVGYSQKEIAKITRRNYRTISDTVGRAQKKMVAELYQDAG